MAVVYYTGNQQPRAYSSARTITSATAGQTITATVNSKVETYTCVSGETTSTAAANLAAQLNASLAAEFRDFTFTANGAVVTAAGPVDGKPVAISWGGTASGTTATVSAQSPFDISQAANYSGGSLPVNGDDLVVENTAVSLLYGLGQFASNTVRLIRRGSHTGQIGLPDTNPLGFPEYLTTHFASAATSATIEDGGSGFVRYRSAAGSAATITVTGEAAGTPGAEAVEIHGTPANSVLNLNGGSVAFCPLGSQTGTLATVRLANCSFRCGDGGTLGAVTANNSQVVINGGYTTYSQGNGTQAVFGRASAAATSTTVDDGTVQWRSTGTFGNLTVRSGGTFDNSRAPAAVTAGTITMDEGSAFLDPNRRIARPFSIVKNGAIANMTIDVGDGSETVDFN